MANFRHILSLQTMILLWLISIGFGALSFAGFQPVEDSNLVFCPLQKIWVKKYIPAEQQPVELPPLENICASNKQKESFIYAGFQKFAFTQITLDSKQTENLFFGYAEKGKDAFETFSNTRSLPETHLNKRVMQENALFNFQKNYLKKEAVKLFLPTLSSSFIFQTNANFAPQKFCSLENISRKISPRAPPVLA